MKSTSQFKLTGVAHLPPMPGCPGSPGIDCVIEFALSEARTLESAGFSSILIENEGDRPHLLQVTEEYRQNMSRVVKAVRSHTKLPIGLEILYDMVGTVRVGIDASADFVRLDVFTDDTEVKWGVVQECTAAIRLLRAQFPNSFPSLWADIHVKHGRNLSGRTLAESTQAAVRNGVDALIVTGSITGEPPRREDCEEIRRHAVNLPLYVGSGFGVSNVAELCELCDGAVVATSVQVDGRFDPVSSTRLVEAVQQNTAATL